VGAAHSIEITIRNSLAALHCTHLLDVVIGEQSTRVGGMLRSRDLRWQPSGLIFEHE
jgi:hypothetical protein